MPIKVSAGHQRFLESNLLLFIFILFIYFLLASLFMDVEMWLTSDDKQGEGDKWRTRVVM
jgi:hypothetical protein